MGRSRGRPSKRKAPEPAEDPISGESPKSLPNFSACVKKTRKPKPEPEPEAICRPSEGDTQQPEEDEFIDSGELDEGEELEPCALFPAGVKRTRKADPDSDAIFIGDPVPAGEAIQRWPHHYKKDNKGKNGSVLTDANGNEYEEQAKRHYTQAKVDEIVYNLGDDAYVKAGEGEPDYISRILEFFESTEGVPHFSAQWFYRINDTVIQNGLKEIKESKRVFISQIVNDNPLDCLVSKVKIALVKPNDFWYDLGKFQGFN